MHRRIAFALAVLVVPALPGQAASAPAEYHNPGWSRDGRSVLFESTREGKVAIYTISVDGTNLKKLTAGTSNNEQPAWSHDGRRIAFISDRDGHEQVYVMQADGSRQARVVTTPAPAFVPAFSPDDKQIAYSEPGAGGAVSLIVVGVDGSGLRHLTEPGFDVAQMRWGPGGGWIAFSGGAVIAPPPRGAPRDSILAFRRARDAAQEIGVAHSDGTGLRLLTHNNVRDCCVEWSSDGRTLYFVSLHDGSSAIFRMNADGSNVRRVIDGTGVWRATSGKLYTRTTLSGAESIAIVDLNGSQPRRVADATTVPDVFPSPDYRKLIYTKSVAGVAGVYVYDVATGVERVLVSGPARR